MHEYLRGPSSVCTSNHPDRPEVYSKYWLRFSPACILQDQYLYKLNLLYAQTISSPPPHTHPLSLGGESAGPSRHLTPSIPGWTFNSVWRQCYDHRETRQQLAPPFSLPPQCPLPHPNRTALSACAENRTWHVVYWSELKIWPRRAILGREREKREPCWYCRDWWLEREDSLCTLGTSHRFTEPATLTESASKSADWMKIRHWYWYSFTTHLMALEYGLPVYYWLALCNIYVIHHFSASKTVIRFCKWDADSPQFTFPIRWCQKTFTRRFTLWFTYRRQTHVCTVLHSLFPNMVLYQKQSFRRLL